MTKLMNMSHTKMMILLICVLIGAIMSIGGIYAYFISSSSAENSLTVKDNTLKINETVVYPDAILPNRVTQFPKDVSIENTGPSECDVTVSVHFSTSEMENMTTLNLNLGTGEDQWTSLGDGKYKYNSKLRPGESTSSLFDSVTINSQNAGDNIEDFQIYIYAESYKQSENL